MSLNRKNILWDALLEGYLEEKRKKQIIFDARNTHLFRNIVVRRSTCM
jgi:hypothetical protein